MLNRRTRSPLREAAGWWMRVCAVLCVFASGTVSAGDAAPPASWPNWLGPNWDGVSSEGGWSTDWPAAGLPTIWTREVGIGFSAVTIADGRLYTMGHENGRETVWCLDVSTGETIWQHSYPGELVDNLHEGGPGATPTLHKDRLYTLGRAGQLHCYQAATGDLHWQRSLQSDLGVKLPEWGFTSSPRILGGKLLIEAGRLAAYDPQTGEPIWRTEPHLAGYGSVAPMDWNGQSLVTALDCEGLRVVELETGKPVAFAAWRSPFRTNSTTPIVVDDTIFISTGYGVGSALFKLEAGNLRQVYAQRDMKNHFNNSILHDSFLYGLDGNSNLGRIVQLTCIEHATGEVRWQQTGFGCGSLMIADGKLVILSEKGELVIAAASPEQLQILCRAQVLTGRCWTVPVLFAGRVFARNAQGRLVCVELPRAAGPATN
ncbi:MAG: PQQ-binding-like beta-propeller repeat protein [Planctomycetaceae bacterium]